MNKWIIRPKIRKNARIRLFCFPYAGSSAVVTYKYLVDSLPPDIEVCPVEFPGRGSRISEKLVSNINEVLDQLDASFSDYLDKPYIFLGHSMGALVAFELAHQLKKKYNSKAVRLYLSAHRAPFIEKEGKIMHKLSHDDFLNELRLMDGISNEIFEHEELLDLMIPIIRNDYQLCETYNFHEHGKIDIPFLLLGGKNDKDVNYDQLLGWEKLTSSECKIEMLEGDHFYLTKNKEIFSEKISKHLLEDIENLKQQYVKS